VVEIVRQFDVEPRPFGQAAAAAGLEMLAKVLGRDVRQRADPHRHTHHAAGVLLARHGVDFGEQVGDQGVFVHGGCPSLGIEEIRG
jgi:hypothetical protein